ncbi:MAG: glutaredoxin family protein [Pseudomonadales bacterium]|jgi:glutaredoxin 3|nr:glutaredoxin family protein [Pseudomonadales bacterium]
MPEITVYTRRFCSYCTAAKSLLQSNGYEFVEVNLDQDPDLAVRIVEKSGQRTVPQIFVGETSVGGFQELHAAISNGDFADLAGAD